MAPRAKSARAATIGGAHSMQCATANITLCSRAARIMSAQSALLSAIGFSTTTCRPRRAAALAPAACASFAVTSTTPSTSDVSIASMDVELCAAPTRAAAAAARSASRLITAASADPSARRSAGAIQSRAKSLLPTSAQRIGGTLGDPPAASLGLAFARQSASQRLPASPPGARATRADRRGGSGTPTGARQGVGLRGRG